MTERPVPSPGVHFGVPNEVYHSWNAVSHSWLKKLRVSPAHLLDLMNNGGEESTSDMVFGSAVHCRVLEPDAYQLRYAVRDEGVSGTTKEGKAFKADHEALGQIVLPFKEGRWVDKIAHQAKMHSRFQEWMKRGPAVEVSVVWERDGYLCKCRPDLYVAGLNVVVDLKTTTTGSQQGFAAQTAKLGYHNQAAWYLEGLQKATGQTWDWWFLVCEKRRPFLVNCQGVPRESEAYQRAKASNDEMFELYKTCMTTRKWPGYADVDEIRLPEWALEQEGLEEESFDS